MRRGFWFLGIVERTSRGWHPSVRHEKPYFYNWKRKLLACEKIEKPVKQSTCSNTCARLEKRMLVTKQCLRINCTNHLRSPFGSQRVKYCILYTYNVRVYCCTVCIYIYINADRGRGRKSSRFDMIWRRGFLPPPHARVYIILYYIVCVHEKLFGGRIWH